MVSLFAYRLSSEIYAMTDKSSHQFMTSSSGRSWRVSAQNSGAILTDVSLKMNDRSTRKYTVGFVFHYVDGRRVVRGR